jgi:2-C-methyl-D-erythritol 4-phosphate cytidylyltransferase
MKRAVIIVAAGSGSRMGTQLPKQYMQLQGKPVIMHTLERFRRFDPQMKIVVVLAPSHRELWEQLLANSEAHTGLILAEGGASRFESVKNGLSCFDEGVGDLLLGIHDAVRPLVSQGTLLRSYEAAYREGSGIPVIEMEESVRRLDKQGGSFHMDRSMLKRVQTPQVFSLERILKAYKQAYDPVFTDDASVYESLYGSLTLVEGNRENIKITTPTDLQLASLLITSFE